MPRWGSAGRRGSRPAAPTPGASGAGRPPGAGRRPEAACCRRRAGRAPRCPWSRRARGPTPTAGRPPAGRDRGRPAAGREPAGSGPGSAGCPPPPRGRRTSAPRRRACLGEEEDGRQGDHPTHTGPGQHGPVAPERVRSASPGVSCRTTPNAKIQIGRSTTTVRNTATATRIARGRPERGVDDALRRCVCVCRPMTRKTAFSSRYWIVVQLIRSASRDGAVWISGALWPSSTPAMTTARTPEAWMSSAGR